MADANVAEKELKNEKKEEVSWAGMVDHFLKTPPTESIFRLYLLSFVLWNKGVILYILFGNADMADKLAIVNWRKYVYVTDEGSIFSVNVSLYLGPMILALFIYYLVFSKIKRIGEISLYDYLFKKHHTAELDRLKVEKDIAEKEIEVEDKKKEVIEKRVENIISEKKTKEELYKSAPVPEDPKWKEDYEFFKKTNHFFLFGDMITDIFYSEKNAFEEPSNKYYVHSRYVGIFKYLVIDACIDKKNDYYFFSDKGKFFIKMYEFEKEKGLL
jgi:hypothetical protein